MICKSSKHLSYAPCLMGSHSFTGQPNGHTRKGRARRGTLHPHRISKRCYSFHRPRKDGSLRYASDLCDFSECEVRSVMPSPKYKQLKLSKSGTPICCIPNNNLNLNPNPNSDPNPNPNPNPNANSNPNPNPSQFDCPDFDCLDVDGLPGAYSLNVI